MLQLFRANPNFYWISKLRLLKCHGYVRKKVWICAGVWGLNGNKFPALENKDRLAENSFCHFWNNRPDGKWKLLKRTGADAGSL